MEQKKRKTKKKKSGQIVMTILFMAVGAFCGAFGVHYVIGDGTDTLTFGGTLLILAEVLLCLYAAMFLQIIFHEGGHLIFGLATGYRFLSFRVFGLMILRSEGKLRLKKFSLAGTGGQCLMAPPEIVDGKMPYVLYNLGGVLMNLLSAAVFLGLFFLCGEMHLPGLFCISAAVIGVIYAAVNGIPMQTGTVDNDGRNIVSISKSGTALRCFRIQMLISAETANGVRLRDMPEEWFDLPEDADLNNAIIASVKVFEFSRMMDKGDFASALTLGEKLAEHDGVLGLHRMIIASELIYCELISANRSEIIERYKTKEFNQFAKSMKTNPSILRMQYAYELLYNRDESAAEKKRNAFEKAAQSYPYPNEIKGERHLMEIAKVQYSTIKTE